MELTVVAVAVGVVLSVLAGGTLARILATPVRVVWLPFAGLGAQLLLGLWAPSGGWGSGLAVVLLAGSFAAVLAFALLNLHFTGMAVVAVGVGLNLLVVALNGAMPVRLPEDASDARREALEHSATHEPEADADTLARLGQIVLVPEPVDRAVSWGDLIVGVGLVDVLFHAGRRRMRPNRGTAPAPDSGGVRDPARGDAAEGHDHPAVGRSPAS